MIIYDFIGRAIALADIHVYTCTCTCTNKGMGQKCVFSLFFIYKGTTGGKNGPKITTQLNWMHI